VVDVAEDVDAEGTATGVNIVQPQPALLFFGPAVLSWHKRPREGGPAPHNELLRRLDGIGVAGAPLVVAMVSTAGVLVPLAPPGRRTHADTGLTASREWLEANTSSITITITVLAALGSWWHALAYSAVQSGAVRPVGPCA
jgi:hypothetical protein